MDLLELFPKVGTVTTFMTLPSNTPALWDAHLRVSDIKLKIELMVKILCMEIAHCRLKQIPMPIGSIILQSPSQIV